MSASQYIYRATIIKRLLSNFEFLIKSAIVTNFAILIPWSFHILLGFTRSHVLASQLSITWRRLRLSSKSQTLRSGYQRNHFRHTNMLAKSQNEKLKKKSEGIPFVGFSNRSAGGPSQTSKNTFTVFEYINSIVIGHSIIIRSRGYIV